MSSHMQKFIESVQSIDFTCIEARTVALKAHNELYHFQMALHEAGEEALAQELTRVVQTIDGFTYSEASMDAGFKMKTMMEICEGKKIFATARENLREEGK